MTCLPTSRPRLLPPTLLSTVLMLLLILVLAGCGSGPPHPGAPGVGAGTDGGAAAQRPETTAAAVVHAWDRRRAEAWAAGSVRRLRALYVPGAAAGRADVAALRVWVAHGRRLEGLTTRLAAIQVLDETPASWRVRVVDRVVGGTVLGRGGRHALAPGRDRAWVISLVRRRGVWLVARVDRG